MLNFKLYMKLPFVLVKMVKTILYVLNYTTQGWA